MESSEVLGLPAIPRTIMFCQVICHVMVLSYFTSFPPSCNALYFIFTQSV